MPTGVSPLYYPEQPQPKSNLKLDDSYFLIKLHDTQVFFQSGWLSKPGFVTLSSSVDSSFQANSPTQSLHKISTIQKNIPCHLGVLTNLTNWLPMRTGDSLQINIKYTVLQDKPIRNLITQMEQADLVAKLSLRPDWVVALKVSNVVGKLLSYLVQEGEQHEVFPLAMDLNMADLKTGYYVVIGSHTDELWPAPKFMQIDSNGRFLDKSAGSLLSRLSYAVIEVLGIPRLNKPMFVDEPWFELLETVKENILDNFYDPNDQEERGRLLGEWYFALKQVRGLARKRLGFLQSEIREIIASAQVEIDTKLQQNYQPEASGLDEELPDELQDILGVTTEKELQGLAKNYQTALAVSQKLIEEYNLAGD